MVSASAHDRGPAGAARTHSASTLTETVFVNTFGACLPWLPRAVGIVFLGQNRGGDHGKTMHTARFICKSPRHARIRRARASHQLQVGYDAELG